MTRLGESDWDEERPAELAAAGRDPRVIAELALIFERNSRHEDGAKRYLGPGEAETLARRVLEELLDPDGIGMADVGGFRFYLQVGSDLYPGPSEVLANAWDTNQWRPIGRVRLAGGTGDGEA